MGSNMTRKQARAQVIALAHADESPHASEAMLAMLMQIVADIAHDAPRLPSVESPVLFDRHGQTFWGEGADGDEVRRSAFAIVRAAVLLVAQTGEGSQLTRMDLAAVRLARSCLSSASSTPIDRADCAELLGTMLERIEGDPTLPPGWPLLERPEKGS